MTDDAKIILVTGAAGYVGSTFVRDALADGYRIRCLDLLLYGGKAIAGFMNHPNFEFFKGDIREKKDLETCLGGADYVVHLAAIVGDRPCQASPVSAYQINFEGTQLLAEKAKKAKIKRFVFASTCSNYGVSDPNQLAVEETALNPVSLYAETKIDCERFLQECSTDDFSVTSLRFGTAFGTSFRTRFDLLVNSFAYEAWTTAEIVVFAANTWRPYVHVADMSLIIRQILQAPKGKICGQIYNAGSTAQNYLKKDIVRILTKVLPNIKTKYIDSIEDRRDYRVSFEKLETNLGFKPLRSVEDGFHELLKGFQTGILTRSDFEATNLDALEKYFRENSHLSKKSNKLHKLNK